MIQVKLKDPLIYSGNTSPESAISADQLSEGLQRHQRPRPEKLAEPKTGAGKQGIVDPGKEPGFHYVSEAASPFIFYTVIDWENNV